jgi:peptidoglycan/LPS O-acetylase OafA/YrhL
VIRFVELALFVAPLAIFAVWRVMGTKGGPSRRLVVVSACLLAVAAGVLFWWSQEDALPPGATYAPARLQDGEVVSGHAAPR